MNLNDLNQSRVGNRARCIWHLFNCQWPMTWVTCVMSSMLCRRLCLHRLLLLVRLKWLIQGIKCDTLDVDEAWNFVFVFWFLHICSCSKTHRVGQVVMIWKLAFVLKCVWVVCELLAFLFNLKPHIFPSRDFPYNSCFLFHHLFLTLSWPTFNQTGCKCSLIRSSDLRRKRLFLSPDDSGTFSFFLPPSRSFFLASYCLTSQLRQRESDMRCVHICVHAFTRCAHSCSDEWDLSHETAWSSYLSKSISTGGHLNVSRLMPVWN